MMLNTYSADFLKVVTEQKNKYGRYFLGNAWCSGSFCPRFLVHDKTIWPMRRRREEEEEEREREKKK